jgi:hypothetical protein
MTFGCGEEDPPPPISACSTNQAQCSGACVDIQSDSQNCGMCGVQCGGSDICIAGQCQSETGCTGSQSFCSSQCVDTTSDRNHCGGCNNACGMSQTCQNSVCSCSGIGLNLCGSECVNIQANNQHCGGCDIACGGEEQCIMGMCRQQRPEVCNNLDDDLDGLLDEGEMGGPYTVPCDNLCGTGEKVCTDGRLSECNAPTPVPESCDEQDNDCDGLVDEGVAMTYYEDADRDGYGSTSYAQAKISCTPPSTPGPNGGSYLDQGGDCNDDNNQIYPGAEEVPGDDNDCDGTVDEGLECAADSTQMCGREVGECRLGTQACSNDGTWDNCGGPDYVAPEMDDVCDGRDEDCDGLIDEGGEDDYEANNSCDLSRQLPNVNENDDPTTYNNMSLYRTDTSTEGDVDYYHFKANDGYFANGIFGSICTPFIGKQCFSLFLDFTLPAEAEVGDYQVCLKVIDDDDAPCDVVDELVICQDDPSVIFDANTRTYSFGFEWDGTCGASDNRFFSLEVKGINDEINVCSPYTISLSTQGRNDECSDED